MGIDRKRKTVYWSEEIGRFMKSFSVDLNMRTNKELGLRIAERSVREAFKWSNFRVEIDRAIVPLTPEVRGTNPWPKVYPSIALKDPHKKKGNAVIYSSSATMLNSHIATSKFLVSQCNITNFDPSLDWPKAIFVKKSEKLFSELLCSLQFLEREKCWAIKWDECSKFRLSRTIECHHQKGSK